MKFILNYKNFLNENKKSDEKWIQSAKLKKGTLKKMLGYKEEDNIPDRIIDEIAKEKIGSSVKVLGKNIKITKLMKKRAQTAINLRK